MKHPVPIVGAGPAGVPEKPRRSRWLAALAAALIASSASVWTLPPSADAAALADIPPGFPAGKTLEIPPGMISSGPSGIDYLSGQGQVLPSGDYAYSIPLAIPQGRLGMQPRLSLEYSSSAGPGLAGLGWSVAGLSRIARCAKTLAADGVTKGVQFDTSDTFCLNGQKLVGTSSPYGGVNATYATETDGSLRIISRGTAADIAKGPDSFEVDIPNGRIQQYEATDFTVDRLESRVDHISSTWSTNKSQPSPQRVVWLLRSERDQDGNRVEYNYHEETPGEFNIDTITYTWGPEETPRRMVKFVYEGRGDEVSGFSAGMRFAQTKRIKSIEMHGPNPTAMQRVWSYELGYGAASQSGRSMLRSIKKCGQNETCTRSKIFDYGDSTMTPSYQDAGVVYDTVNEKAKRPPGLWVSDLNDDGLDDAIYSKGADEIGLDSVFVRVGRRTVTGQVNALSEETEVPATNGWTAPLRFSDMRAVDADHDGKGELAVPYRSSAASPLSTALEGWDDTNHKFVSKESGMEAGSRPEFLDLDGDGRKDYLTNKARDNALIPELYAAQLNTGSSPIFGAAQATTFAEGCKVHGTDIDGDGRMELVGREAVAQYKKVITDPDNPDGTIEVLEPKEPCSGPTSILRYTPAGQLVKEASYSGTGVVGYRTAPFIAGIADILGDFNGDGLQDVLSVPDGTGDATLMWNTGNGLEVAGPVTVPRTDKADVRVDDFNGDGRDDLLALSNDGSYLLMSKGDGTFADGGTLGAKGAMIPDQGRMVETGDFNGDGRVDVVLVTGSQMLLKTFSGAVDDDRMVAVRDSGTPAAREKVTYSTQWSERPDQMFSAAPCGNMETCFRHGFPVVRKIEFRGHLGDSATAGTQARVLEFSYEDPVGNFTGRGSLGFGSFRIWDAQTPAEITYTFPHRQRVGTGYYPGVGRVGSVTTVVPIMTQAQVAGKPAAMPAKVSRSTSTFTVRQIGSTYRVFDTGTTSAEWTQGESGNAAPKVGIEWGNLAGTSKDQHLGGVPTTPPADARKRSITITVPATGPFVDYDAFGNLTHYKTSTDGMLREEVTQGFLNKTTNGWIIGLPTTTVVKRTEPGTKEAVTRTLENVYDNEGHLLTEYVEKDSLTPRMTTHRYGEDGMPSATTVDDDTKPDETTETGLPPVETRLEYDTVFGETQPERVFPSQVWSPHTLASQRPSVWTAIHPSLGVPVATLDINGVASSVTYDDLGRPVATNADGAASATVEYAVHDPNGDKNGIEVKTTTKEPGSGKPPVSVATTVTDAVDRTYSTTVNGLAAGSKSTTSTRYDVLGRAVEQAAAAPQGTTTTVFDSLSRPVTVLSPDKKITSYAYTYTQAEDGTEVVDPTNVKKRSFTDRDGRLVRTVGVLEDKVKGTVQDIPTVFTYHPFNLLATATDHLGNKTVMNYDVRGNRTHLEEPDKGTTDTTFFGTGQVDTEKHVESKHESTFSYDDLGRKIQAVTEDGISVFGYDSAAHGIGKPAFAENQADKIRTEYRYDEASRPAGTDLTDKETSRTYSSDQTYDAMGRLSTQAYPDAPGRARADGKAFTVRYGYSATGFLSVISNKTQSLPEQVYWALTGRKPNLALESAMLNGDPTATVPASGAITLSLGYEDQTGRLKTQTATKTGSTTKLQGLTYGYYDNGMVHTRDEAGTGVTRNEVYTYDTLLRLTKWGLSGEPIGTGHGADYSYDTLGNLLTVTSGGKADRRDYGNSLTPHTMTGYTPAGGTVAQPYHHDSEGRQDGGGGRTTTYTAFDLPKTIVKDGKTSTYRYDAYGNRVQEKVADATGQLSSTLYLPGLYEERTTGAKVVHVAHLQGVDGATIQVAYDAQAALPFYGLVDHQGSVGTVVDKDGAAVQKSSYDPFGATVQADGTPTAPPSGPVTRGYTGHESDDHTGLINMKGRVFDPLTKRFLTPDPLISDTANSQAWNPYSYVLNNPVNLTDPSGLRPCDDGQLINGSSGSDCADAPHRRHGGIPQWDMNFQSTASQVPGCVFDCQGLWNEANLSIALEDFYTHSNSANDLREIITAPTIYDPVGKIQPSVILDDFSLGDGLDPLDEEDPWSLGTRDIFMDISEKSSARIKASANRMHIPANVHVVVAHSDGNTFGLNPGDWKKHKDFTADRLAEMVLESGVWDGKKILIVIACNIGAASNSGARNLTEAFNRPILAPTRTAWWYSNGAVTVGASYTLPLPNSEGWKMFYPRSSP